MAEKLDSFQFRYGSKGGSRYDQWLDGAIYRLSAPGDIPSPESGRRALVTRATKKGMKVRTHVERNALVVQAYKPEQPLRVAS